MNTADKEKLYEKEIEINDILKWLRNKYYPNLSFSKEKFELSNISKSGRLQLY